MTAGQRSIPRRLLAWFDAHRRDLPWRRDPDPYRVWVSEIMCQQTRVDVAVPYFERWMDRFHDVDALADADEADVLRHWEGLGYYARARNLHSAAKVVRERHAGLVPSDADTLAALPGIGAYTAGAIASIAFGRPTPAVDGNARRVLARLADLHSPGEAELRRMALSLIDQARPGDFNQALMELGALLCTPRSPACDACPLVGDCAARAAGTQEIRPLPRTRRPVPEFAVGTAVVMRADHHVLLARRPSSGLLGGLWEFPGDVAGEHDAAENAAHRAAARFGVRDVEPNDGEAAHATVLEPVRHTFSHFRAEYTPVLLRPGRSSRTTTAHTPESCTRGQSDGPAAAATPASAQPHWIALPDLPAVPMSAAQRRIAQRVAESVSSRCADSSS